MGLGGGADGGNAVGNSRGIRRFAAEETGAEGGDIGQWVADAVEETGVTGFGFRLRGLGGAEGAFGEIGQREEKGGERL